MGFTAIAMLLCEYAGLVAPHRQKGAANAKRMLLTNLLVAVLCLGGVTAHVTLIDYYNTLGITVYTWRPLESYWREGYLPAFISAAQSIKPPKAADYSVDDAKAALKKYAKAYDKSDAAKSDERTAAKEQFDSEKPTVIAIMNETFSDLSIYQNMRAGYEGPQYFKNLSNCLSRGKLYVSAYGGGTANTEFEFMTGNSMANLGSGVYPYTIYNMETTGNLAEQFKSLGYSTTAMHPNHATNWNRENVYKDFGFDQFLSINDFQGADTLRGIGDRPGYLRQDSGAARPERRSAVYLRCDHAEPLGLRHGPAAGRQADASQHRHDRSGRPRPSRTARSPMSTSTSRASSSPTRRFATSLTP